jgi:tRNA-dihydrouridine synthase B
MSSPSVTAFQICLAPLRGVTDAVFRTTYAEHFTGIDWAVTPFLSTTKGPRIKPAYLKEVLPESNRGMPIVPQIISKSADNFLLLAAALVDLGHDTINWNLGCPYPMVAKKGRGSGLLPHPETIEAFLERVLAILPNRLSIKLRLGRWQCDEIDALLPIFNRLPIKQIIVHPRTGEQMYSGLPDLDAFGRCLELSRHPVIYNGDITALQDFNMLQARFAKVKTWMIGRGAISDPFLPGHIKGVACAPAERLATFRQFHDHLYVRYGQTLCGPSHLINRMKGLWGYFATGFKGGEKLRKRINKTQTPQHYCEVVASFFDGSPQWQGGVPTLVGNRRA